MLEEKSYLKKRCEVDLTNLPQEFHLMLKLLSKSPDVCDISFKRIDWQKFIQLTIHHRVYPVLYETLKMVEVPRFVIKRLQQLYEENTFNMLRYSAVTEQMSRLFLEEDIHILFLKGPTLGHDLYGNMSQRTSSDIDVIIPIHQLEKADGILKSEGFKKIDYIKTVLNDWTWRHHHVAYYHPQLRVKFEVHWRLHPGPGKEPSFQQLWSRKQKSRLTNTPIYTLNNEDLFAYLVTHGARHGWSRLRWLIDIKKLTHQGVHWENAFNILKTYQGVHIGEQALILLFNLFEIPLPSEIKPKYKSKKIASEAIFYLESMIHLHTDPVPVNVSRYHKRHLLSLMSWRKKILFTLSFLYPYPEDAETLRLPQQLHFLYFPLRPFLWIWRKTRELAIT